jgi:RNA:NAD 2'-phosphotransferase (TPT1/KptA family)
MEMTMSADPTDVVLEEEIAGARKALVKLARQDPEQWWTAHELKVRARNGWSSGVMGLALQELLDDGRFEQRHDLRVRLRL